MLLELIQVLVMDKDQVKKILIPGMIFHIKFRMELIELLSLLIIVEMFHPFGQTYCKQR